MYVCGFFSSIWDIIWSCVTFIFKVIWFIITVGWNILIFLCKLPFKIIGWCWTVIKFIFSLLGDLWHGFGWLISWVWHCICDICSFVLEGIKTLAGYLAEVVVWGWDLCVQLGTFVLQHLWQTVGTIVLLWMAFFIISITIEEYNKNKDARKKQKALGRQKTARLKELARRIPIEDEQKLPEIITDLPPNSKRRRFLALYKNILDELGLLIEDLKKEIVNIRQDAQYEQARAGIGQLVAWHRGLAVNIYKLASCADWDTFTFAFYGETNAGKSTLIESLRLLLKESTKLQEQKHCATYVETVVSLTSQIEQIENRSSKLDSDRALQQQQITSLSVQQQQTESSFRQQQQVLQESLADYKKQMSLWQPGAYFKMRKEVNNKEKELKNLLQKYNKNQSTFRKQKQAFEKNIWALDRQQISLCSQLKY